MASLDDMVLFASVVHAGSFTAAAITLNIPLSTLSRKIALLEQQLDVRLLERTTRSLKTTEQGEVFLDYCQQLIDISKASETALQRLQREPSGNLRFAIPFAVDNHWSAAFIAGFMSKYPKITLESTVQHGNIDLNNSTIDVTLDYGTRPETHHPIISIGNASMVLCASPDYLKEKGFPTQLKDLHQHDLIHFTLISWTEYAPPALKALHPAYRISTNELLMARQACANNLGIAWLPLITVAQQIQEGTLIQILPEQYYELPIWIIFRNLSKSTPKVAVFIQYFTELFGSPDVWKTLEKGGKFRL